MGQLFLKESQIKLKYLISDAISYIDAYCLFQTIQQNLIISLKVLTILESG